MQAITREYETIYVMESAVDPDEADRIAGRLGDIVQKMEGKLTKVDNWGRRKLAYPIRKNSRGVYVYLRYLGSGQTVSELERNLRMIDPVLRYQTVLVRKQVNPSEVTVDPEEIKFKRIEHGDEDVEPGLEQRLGLVDEPRPQRVASDLDEVYEDGEAESDGLPPDEESAVEPD